MKNLIARLVSKRVRELELEVAALQDLVADGITDEYGTPEAWRAAAKSTLRGYGMLHKLINERL